MNNFHVYIHFPEQVINYITDFEIGQKFIKEFLMTIDLADCEKGSILNYSKSNLNSFFDSIELINEEIENVIGNYSSAEIFSIILEKAIDFDLNPLFEKDENICYYKQWISENRNPIDSLEMFKEIFERKMIITNHQSHKTILLNIFGLDFKTNPVKVLKDCRITKKTIIEEFEFVQNFSELNDWLINNRIKRNYNFLDNRHIENHPESLINSHKKSPLIGGLGGKNDASTLLNEAIGDKTKTDDLINFDYTNQSYIWFEFENDNPQNQYHGYHLVRNIGGSYIKDLDAEKLIPKRVKDILEYKKINKK